MTLPDDLLALVRRTKGFMPEDEGAALHDLAAERLPRGPVLEVGSYCGKSAIWLGAAARRLAAESPGEEYVVFTVDHHRGSEENQAGWEHHDAEVVDPESGRMDTLPWLRKTLARAGLEEHVVPIVGRSTTVSRHWRTPLSMLFIDGGHGRQPARDDYRGWARWLTPGGLLVIHDVFPDPAGGGRPPYEDIFLPALASGEFEEYAEQGSLRALRRSAGEAGVRLG